MPPRLVPQVRSPGYGFDDPFPLKAIDSTHDRHYGIPEVIGPCGGDPTSVLMLEQDD